MPANEEKFDLSATDEELLETFDSWKRKSETYHDQLLRQQKLTEQYYTGNQTDRDSIAAHNSNTVENRIFEGVETLVPIATANAHHFTALAPSEDPRSKSRANKTQKVLGKKYQTLELQRKLEDVTRHLLLYRFGCLKYFWNDELNDVDVELIDPRMIFVPKLRLDPHKLPYVMEKQEYTRGEMEEYWPDVNLDMIPASKSPNSHNSSYSSTESKPYVVWEVWTDETVAWFCQGKVLKTEENPNFDFEGEEVDRMKLDKTGKIKKKKEKVFRNHLDNPEKPYVFFTAYRVGDAPFGDTSLVEIAMPIQDAINVQKRQIIDNLRQMGNGQVLMDSDAMSKEEADNITNEPGLVIRGELLASQNKLKRTPGVSLPNGHFSNLQHSESTLDNLLGLHSATRGAAGAKTLGQDLISRQQDFTRIDLITRVLNRGVSRLANGLVQLMKMYYDEEHVFKVLGEEGATEFISFNQNDIEDYVEIDVKSGQVLPMDRVQLRTEAVQLWQLGALDPVTLFERLEFPNPEKAAERLMAYKVGQLTMETQAKIAADNAATQNKAQLQASKPGEENRGVETPQNVLQRATSNLGGGAPSLPQAPKL